MKKGDIRFHVIRLVDVGLQFDGLTLIGLRFVKIRQGINTCACASTLSSLHFTL